MYSVYIILDYAMYHRVVDKMVEKIIKEFIYFCDFFLIGMWFNFAPLLRWANEFYCEKIWGIAVPLFCAFDLIHSFISTINVISEWQYATIHIECVYSYTFWYCFWNWMNDDCYLNMSMRSFVANIQNHS